MKRQVTIPRQQSLISPEIPNPFVHKLHLNFQRKIQIVFMSVFVVPVRLFMIFVCLVFAWMLASISLAFRPKEDFNKPIKGWRRMFETPIRYTGRAIAFFYGFHNIQVKGHPAEPDVAPIIVCAPHCSFMDAFVIFYVGKIPSGVSRQENSSIPILGKLVDYSQPMYVQREQQDSRKTIVKEMTRRAKMHGEWPHLILFPEGTCTNRTCLIGFKQGAFLPGVPVQPVCLRYLNSWDTYTWTWEGPGAFTCLWLTLCQFHNALELEFMPVYTPNEAEQQDPKLFAANVRQKMADCLGVPTTDHTFDDVRLMKKAAALKLPKTAGLIEIQKLNSKLGMNFDKINELLENFGAIETKDKGAITLPEFAAYLHLPVSPALEEIFSLYDRNGSGTIDFREYIIGLSLISQPVNNDDTLQLAFELFDSGNKGHITQEELTEILVNAFGMEHLDVETLFNKVDKNHDERITYDEFKSYAETKPEYAKLFMTYQELKALQDNTNGNGRSKLE